MLIGGFFSVDGATLCKPWENYSVTLPFDTKQQYRTIYTNNGRTASVYGLMHCANRMKNKKVLLPDYLCVSIISAFEEAGIGFEFYRVDEHLKIDGDDLKNRLSDEIGMIYLIHYFSVPQTAQEVTEIKRLAKERNILIMEDITQVMFSAEEQRIGFGDYVVGSLRKWFPMTDGGVVGIKNGLDGDEVELESAYDESVYKELLISVIRKKYEEDINFQKKIYLQYEKEANASRYKNLRPKEMTEASKKILFHTDINELTECRKSNYKYLLKGLNNNERIRIVKPEVVENEDFVPFGMLLVTEDRERLYHYLVENNIIPEIQWRLPTEYYAPGKEAMYFSEHNLMIQCDQRYGEKEMQYVVDVINRY